MQIKQIAHTVPSGYRLNPILQSIADASPSWVQIEPDEGQTLQDARHKITGNSGYLRLKTGWHFQSRIVENQLWIRAVKA